MLTGVSLRLLMCKPLNILMRVFMGSIYIHTICIFTRRLYNVWRENIRYMYIYFPMSWLWSVEFWILSIWSFWSFWIFEFLNFCFFEFLNVWSVISWFWKFEVFFILWSLLKILNLELCIWIFKNFCKFLILVFLNFEFWILKSEV